MDDAIIAATAFLGIFVFAFWLGWFMPLITIHMNDQKERQPDFTLSILDITLMLLDCIPVFWLIRVLPTSINGIEKVKMEWSANKSVRVSFYLFLISIFSLGFCIALIV